MPLGYSVALGIPDLRTAIAQTYSTRHRIVVDPNDVVITLRRGPVGDHLAGEIRRP
jgi:aspartate/methionine/tyrosine aminotransferase